MGAKKIQPPAVMFYVDDFASDGVVEAMTTEQVGASILLLCKAWKEDPPGTVPDDDEILARWSRLPPKKWIACRDRVIRAFVKGEDGRWHQKRMKAEYQRQIEYQKTKSKAGAKGARKRWHNHSSAMAEPIADGMANDSFSLSLSNNTPYPLEGFSQAFQIAWDSYPASKRTKRETAQAAWRDAVVRLAFKFEGDHRKAEDWLHLRVLEFTRSPLAESKFCPGIANFLIDGRYDDAPESWQRDPENGANTPPSKPPEVPHHIPKVKFT